MQSRSLPETALYASASHIITALGAYETASAQLVARWLDMALYAEFSRQLDAIREYGAPLPSLTVLSLELGIAHCELVSAMWQDGSVGIAPNRVQEVQQRHAQAVEALRAAAVRLLPANEAAPDQLRA